jgi:hypothetical protein
MQIAMLVVRLGADLIGSCWIVAARQMDVGDRQKSAQQEFGYQVVVWRDD